MLKDLKSEFNKLEQERKLKRLKEVEMEEEIKFLRQEKEQMQNELRQSKEYMLMSQRQAPKQTREKSIEVYVE